MARNSSNIVRWRTWEIPYNHPAFIKAFNYKFATQLPLCSGTEINFENFKLPHGRNSAHGRTLNSLRSAPKLTESSFHKKKKPRTLPMFLPFTVLNRIFCPFMSSRKLCLRTYDSRHSLYVGASLRVLP